MQREPGNLILRHLAAVDLHCGLFGADREKNYGPRPARRNPHNPRKVLVEAVHPQPVQVDAHRLGAKLAALRDETVYPQVSYPGEICVWLGKCADGARGHLSPRWAKLIVEKLNSIFNERLIWINCQPINHIFRSGAGATASDASLERNRREGGAAGCTFLKNA
jgi:hypothetical protein